MTTLIPQNIKGKKNDLYESVHVPTTEQAITIFQQAYKRISNPFMWHDLTGLPAKFLPASENETSFKNPLWEGNYFKIEIPGPGSSKGSGYDWVMVETVEDKRNSQGSLESFGITLRACSNPYNGSLATAHFFKSLATSSFFLQRDGKLVTASYHGRNEVPNIQTGNLLDNIRNAFVALGAEAGMSELVWSQLLKAFLGKS